MVSYVYGWKFFRVTDAKMWVGPACISYLHNKKKKMDQRHKDLINANLSRLVNAVDYDQLKHHLLDLRVFPPVQLRR